VPIPPEAVLITDDSIGCAPLTLRFYSDSSLVDDSTSIVRGIWRFGDGGGFGTYTDTSYTYTTPGSYVAMLVIQDGYNCTDTAREKIQVNPPTSISIGPAQTICLGDTATLSGSGTPTLHWYPDYNIDTTVLTAPRAWPRTDTTYYLRAGNSLRCYAYDSVRINVSTITATDTAVSFCLGQTTSFTAVAQTTHGSISSYLWHFGDGATGTGPVPTHVYGAYGDYIDSLVVTNSIGCRDTVYHRISVSDRPHASFTTVDTITCLGTPITVTNTSTPGTTVGLATFSFDMQPDGIPDLTTSPSSYTYPTIGVYTILLIQSDSNSCKDTARQRVMVHGIPKAVVNGDSDCINIPTTLSGIATIGDGPVTHYHWTIDGAAQSGDSIAITHVFTTPGAYTICLSVSDTFGCPSPDSCRVVEILSQPQDTIDPLDTTICLGYSAGFHITGRYSGIQWVPSLWVDNPTGSDVVVTPLQTVQYLVYAHYAHCIPKIDTVSIYVIDSVPVEATANPQNIVLGLSSNVKATVKGTIDSIVWDPDTTLSCRTCAAPIATPRQTTTYTATIYYSKNGVTCSNRATVTITVIQSCNNSLIYVPNTFTPNNDNTNDVFRIRGQGISKVNYFRIFDRWGKMVYEATNVENPDDAAWNGALNNDKSRPENSGVFVYLFEIECITGQAVTGKGNVTLIR
jgi:gliding motility-associated-like protein